MTRALFVLLTLAVLPAVAADPVAGKFTGNGQDAKLAFASAHKGEAFAGKPTWDLIFTEKDHARDKKPGFKAGFGDYGSALIVTIQDDGKIIGCVVAHSAHKKAGFSSVGSIATSDFKMAGGKITGKIKTDGEVTTFGEKWLVDLAFDATAP